MRAAAATGAVTPVGRAWWRRWRRSSLAAVGGGEGQDPPTAREGSVRERGRLSLSLSVESVRRRLLQHFHPHLLFRRQCLLRYGLRHGLLVASPHLAVRVHFARFRASAVVLAIAHHHRPPPCHQDLGLYRIRLCTPLCTRLSRRNQTTRRVRACCRARTRAALSAATHPLAAVPGLDSRAPQARPMLAASDVALADGAPATDPRVISINLGESQTARRVAPNSHAHLVIKHSAAAAAVHRKT
mmetsp:Transcript_18007/g.57380  ORF Transcript_18007/g.57380 Transcript_18007/m.57380 type:complete len:243 (-) Transcript_18007:1291-2019(-)